MIGGRHHYPIHHPTKPHLYGSHNLAWDQQGDDRLDTAPSRLY
jgi:hypothetical protein